MAMRLMVDTCVWLDLAKDYREQPVIAALEDLIESGEVKLIEGRPGIMKNSPFLL